jgi:hypothetical protein
MTRCGACGHYQEEHRNGRGECSGDDEAAMGGCDCPAFTTDNPHLREPALLARGVTVGVKSVRTCPSCGGIDLSYCADLAPVLPVGVPAVWTECRSCGWDERTEPF